MSLVIWCAVVMSLVIWCAVVVSIAAVVGVVVLVLQLTAAPPGSGGRPDDLVFGAYRRARRRALLCVGVAVLALVSGMLVDAARPDLLGLPLAVSPGLAAAAALFAYALLPSSADATPGPATASLTRRTAGSFGSWRSFGVTVGIGVTMLVFLAWAGVLADPDDQGRMRAITFAADTAAGAVTSSSSPFPGSFYGVPLALVTVVLAVASYLALRRIASTPTLPVPMLSAEDTHRRRVSTRVVTLLTTAALLGYFGGAAAFAGVTLRSAAASLIGNGGPDHGAIDGVVLAVAGAIMVVTGMGVAGSAVVRAATLRAEPVAVLPPVTAIPVRPS